MFACAKHVVEAMLVMTLAIASGNADAQSWPSKPLRLIVPTAAGGGADVVARLVSSKLTESLGQSVVVENKTGGNGMIGSEIVAKAEPDAYTIGMIDVAHAINPASSKHLPYDSVRDFTPISQLIEGYPILIASLASGLKSVKDVVDRAKANPGKITYASAGVGSAHHLALAWFAMLAGIQLNHIPYRGIGPAVADVIAGHVDIVNSGGPTAVSNIQEGLVVALATLSAERLGYTPEVPTMAELGFPKLVAPFWYGVVAPAKAPPERIARLHREIQTALQQPDVRAKLESMGLEAAPSASPAAFAAFIREEISKYGEIAKNMDEPF